MTLEDVVFHYFLILSLLRPIRFCSTILSHRTLFLTYHTNFTDTSVT